MLRVRLWIRGLLEEIVVVIADSMDSEGCSVRLKGVDQLEMGRGRNGRVHKFRRFRRTRVRASFSEGYQNLKP